MRSAPFAIAIVLVCGVARAEGGGAQLTLAEAVKRAIAHNPTAVTAQEEIKRSEALVEQVRSVWYPTLNANATYTRLDGDRVLSGRVIQGADSFNANLQLTVPIVQARGWVAN